MAQDIVAAHQLLEARGALAEAAYLHTGEVVHSRVFAAGQM